MSRDFSGARKCCRADFPSPLLPYIMYAAVWGTAQRLECYRHPGVPRPTGRIGRCYTFDESRVLPSQQSFDQLEGTYWEPFAVTCGCDTCNLASCIGTTPISVEYEVCNGWGEVSAPLKNFVDSIIIVRWYLV